MALDWLKGIEEKYDVEFDDLGPGGRNMAANVDLFLFRRGRKTFSGGGS